jgi:glycerophosphoryl diester phosphodiesterase
VRIPTLVEALLWTLDQRWLVNVEIKPTNEDPKTLVNAVLNAIETTRAWDYVTISSFDHEVVNAVAIREPRLATGALIGGPLDQKTAAWLHRVKIDAVHGPPWSSDPSNDRPILVYTVNDAESGGLASRLADSGVAGLFTDDPSSLLRLFGLNRS